MEKIQSKRFPPHVCRGESLPEEAEGVLYKIWVCEGHEPVRLLSICSRSEDIRQMAKNLDQLGREIIESKMAAVVDKSPVLDLAPEIAPENPAGPMVLYSIIRQSDHVSVYRLFIVRTTKGDQPTLFVERTLPHVDEAIGQLEPLRLAVSWQG